MLINLIEYRIDLDDKNLSKVTEKIYDRSHVEICAELHMLGWV